MVQSDADDQLLLSIPLSTTCKVRSIKITASAGKFLKTVTQKMLQLQNNKNVILRCLCAPRPRNCAFLSAGATAPTRVRVFANRAEMGFDDVEDFPATQEWELTPDMLKEDAEPMQVCPRHTAAAALSSLACDSNHPPSPPLAQTKYVKFQKVTGLQFFFENEEGEVSAVSRVQIFGSAGDAVDVGE